MQPLKELSMTYRSGLSLGTYVGQSWSSCRHSVWLTFDFKGIVPHVFTFYNEADETINTPLVRMLLNSILFITDDSKWATQTNKTCNKKTGDFYLVFLNACVIVWLFHFLFYFVDYTLTCISVTFHFLPCLFPRPFLHVRLCFIFPLVHTYWDIRLSSDRRSDTLNRSSLS